MTPIQEHSSGLKQGDVVVAVEGSSIESWAQALLKPGLTRPQWHAGQTISYTVLRHGHRLDVPVTLEPYPLGPILMGATTWSLGLQVGDLVNGIGFWLYLITTAGVYTLFWVGILHFALVFPEAHPVVAKRPWTIPFIYIIPFAFSFAYLAIAWPRSVSALDWISNWDVIESILPAVYLNLDACHRDLELPYTSYHCRPPKNSLAHVCRPCIWGRYPLSLVSSYLYPGATTSQFK